MSQDGAPDPREQGAPEEQTQPATEWVLPSDGRSRRAFLRTALIGSAAVAAVVGGGAVVAATPIGPRILRKITPAGALTSPNPDGMCFEESQLPGTPLGCIQVYKNADGKIIVNPGSFWIVFVANSLAADTYSLKIEQSTDGGITKSLISASSEPFEFAEKNVNYVIRDSPFSGPCIDKATVLTGKTQAVGDPITGLVVGSGQSLAVALHLAWNKDVSTNVPAGTETITFYGTLSNSVPTVVDSFSTSVVAQNAACS